MARSGDEAAQGLLVSSPSTADDGQATAPQADFTYEQAMQHVGFGLFQHKLLFLAGACWMADAMEIMLLSFLLPKVHDDWGLTKWEESGIGSAVFAGMLCGAYTWGVISDRFGRRKGFLATAVLTAVFGLISAFSVNYEMLLVTRCLTGFGIGGAHVSFNLFGEFLPSAQRGRYLVYIEIFWTVGTLLEAGIAWAILDQLGWRVLLAVSSIPLFLLLLCYPALPESPRYLLVSGQREQAEEVLRKAAKANGRALPSGQLISTVQNVERGRVSDLFHPTLRTLTILLWFIWFVNTLAYYGLVIFTPDYFEAEGEQGDVYMDVFITSAAEFPGILIAAFMVDRIGRKNTMTVLMLICGVALMLLMAPLGIATLTVVPVLARMSIMGSFCTIWVYTPEVYPTTIRSTGLGAASSFSRIAGISTPFIAKGFSGSSMYASLVIYGGSALLAALASHMLPIDTTARQLVDSLASPTATHDSEGETPPDTSSVNGDDATPRKTADVENGEAHAVNGTMKHRLSSGSRGGERAIAARPATTNSSNSLQALVTAEEASPLTDSPRSGYGSTPERRQT